jgi:acyl dehydratase
MPGMFFEDFEAGLVFEHDAARSVTQFDNIWYSCMTLNTQPLHSNIDFSERMGLHKKPLFNSMYTLSIIVGQASGLTHGTLVRNIKLDEIEFPKPTFAEDTLYSRTTVLGGQDEGVDPRGGIVDFLHEGINQRRELVASCKRTVVIRRRGASGHPHRSDLSSGAGR